MSHFVVLVIGDDVDGQLAPFDENLSVETVEEDGETYSHNPDAKWDWYQVGGRWTGFFKGKPGVEGDVGEPGVMTDEAEDGRFDSLRKGDIDIEGMRAEAAAKAGAEWDKVRQALGDLSLPPKWDEFRQQFPDIDDARKAYHELPSVKALQAADLMPWFGCPAERYGFTREEFCQRAADRALSTFAVLKDGKWYERGNMGWWGMVSNEMDEADWLRKFNELIDDLPDDTLLTVVDCHI